MPFLTKAFVSNARLNVFSGAELDQSSKGAHLYQLRVEVHPVVQHIPGQWPANNGHGKAGDLGKRIATLLLPNLPASSNLQPRHFSR